MRFTDTAIDKAVNGGLKTELSAAGKHGARQSAVCGLWLVSNESLNEVVSDGSVSFADWVYLTGRYLSIYALNAYPALEGRIQSAERAKKYLEYAGANGRNVQKEIDALNKAFFSKPENTTASATPVRTASAVKLVEERNDNTFAFDRKHLGKTLRVNGKISYIGKNGRDLNLIGNTKLDADHIGFQHYAYCLIDKEENLDAVALVKKGQTITIQGIYNPNSTGIRNGQFVLQDCMVVR
jgi:hypothetical protein